MKCFLDFMPIKNQGIDKQNINLDTQLNPVRKSTKQISVLSFLKIKQFALFTS